MYQKRLKFLISLLFILVILGWSGQLLAQLFPVRVDRWLEVRELSGNVSYHHGQTTRPARPQDRLSAIGDTITTGRNSAANLVIDTGMGSVQVAEATTVRVQQLDTASDGGRITRLRVTGGQVRLQVRRLTNPSSTLEIETPAGISGVRGTVFGIGVQPDGKTGVATLEGQVVAMAQGEQVPISGGLQSLVVPGSPPTPPTPLREDPRLDLRLLASINSRTARIAGQIDPVNLLLIDQEPQTVDLTGQFDLQVPFSNRRLVATVITPLGSRREYQLSVP
ncbi:FecR domain-containing protein [Leptolyngbya sp. FACHB-16]|uniref:FecR domain-containing protein n=1 Tax=Leptolyngbya sp. NM3-A1 TaxID=2933910 RepID=UPI0016899693|nr:FecR domain-containing protein [Leptolyngbya sp. FACHB-16]